MPPKQLIRNQVIALVKRALKWLETTSNVGREETNKLQEELQRVEEAINKEGKLPSLAVRDLKLPQVEKLFRLKKIRPNPNGHGEDQSKMWTEFALTAPVPQLADGIYDHLGKIFVVSQAVISH